MLAVSAAVYLPDTPLAYVGPGAELGAIGTLVFAALPIWGADVMRIVPAKAVIAYFSRVDTIVTLSVVMAAIWILWA